MHKTFTIVAHIGLIASVFSHGTADWEYYISGAIFFMLAAINEKE